MRDSARILLEAAPAGRDTRTIAADLARREGVGNVHHVHLWSISEARPMITLQARLDPGADPAAARRAIRERLESRHGIGHATIEVDDDPAVPRPPPQGASR